MFEANRTPATMHAIPFSAVRLSCASWRCIACNSADNFLFKYSLCKWVFWENWIRLEEWDWPCEYKFILYWYVKFVDLCVLYRILTLLVSVFCVFKSYYLLLTISLLEYFLNLFFSPSHPQSHLKALPSLDPAQKSIKSCRLHNPNIANARARA